ncbi:hypothetical protein SKAU_G00269010 [Synaphobranchus kaupii]|uniref:Small ribosomal subunit protein RACK1 n=1 Tax=Synaphobranchus kaupii TaxID=118154 RepID=A0A9Q1EZW5_SYNKA|nr:hypothetical protein SKAU_G00269010 [Synaphobranchus kaupii]
MILSASRDRTGIMWKLTRDYGISQRSLQGHEHFVSDVVFSSDGQFALSGTRATLSGCPACVSLNSSNPIIVSCGWEKMVKDESHTEWVSCVRFSEQQQPHHRLLRVGEDGQGMRGAVRDTGSTLQTRATLSGCPACVSLNSSNPIIVSCGWEKMVKDESHTEWVSCVRFSEQQQPHHRLLRVGEDGQAATPSSSPAGGRRWSRTRATLSGCPACVSLNSSNPIIVSCGWEKMVKDESHTEWVSCVRFSEQQQPHHRLLRVGEDGQAATPSSSPAGGRRWSRTRATLSGCPACVSLNSSNPIIVSCGWEKMVKDESHTEWVSCVRFSEQQQPHHRLLRDGQTMLWDLNEGKQLYTLDGGDTINALCFSPNRYWLCAATGPSIKIWDLEGKIIVDELRQEVISTNSKPEPPQCTSLAWSADGQTLLAGYTDNLIRVWQVTIGPR